MDFSHYINAERAEYIWNEYFPLLGENGCLETAKMLVEETNSSLLLDARLESLLRVHDENSDRYSKRNVPAFRGIEVVTLKKKFMDTAEE